MTETFNKIMVSLADRFCERRAYKCLLRFLPAFYVVNGLTDGWEYCRKALADTRALCRDDLKDDEVDDINKAMNMIDKMLRQR